MNELTHIALFSAGAFALTWAAYPVALRTALRYHILDNPDARKLQREPVPVLGGTAVAAALLPMIMLAQHVLGLPQDWPLLLSLLLITAIGVTDDIRGLSAVLRFLLEIGIMGALIGFSHHTIDMLQGLFGLPRISIYTAVPFSIFAGVGILNSINLIDGIDGYSSGFCTLAFCLFGGLFLHCSDVKMAAICFIAAAALIPFFCHNALIRRGKMYIGDGGTMMLGLLLAYCVFCTTDSQAPAAQLAHENISLGAFSLAVLCIPIFDTLRVMCSRLAKGRSPFHPDKTHLHHLYIEYGFSHLQTTGLIILTNLLIVGCWALSAWLGLCPAGQFVLVSTLGTLCTFVYYPLAHKTGFLKH